MLILLLLLLLLLSFPSLFIFFMIFIICLMFLLSDDFKKLNDLSDSKIDKFDIDGLKIDMGNEINFSVEGPKNSFQKWWKKLTTGKDEYSAKIKIGNNEIFRIGTDGKIRIK